MNDNRLSYYEKIYLIGISIITFKITLDSSAIISWSGAIDNLIIAAYLVCMIYKVLHQTYSPYTLVLYALLGVLCLYTCKSADNFYLVFTYFAIICLQNVDIKKVIKTTFTIKVSILVFHVVYFLIMYVVARGSIPYFYRNGVRRVSFYMGHPNTFTAFLCWVCLEYIYLNYKKINWKQLIAVWGVNYIFYMFTNSNTGLITMTMTIFFAILDKAKVKAFNKLLYFMAKYGFAFCSIFFAYIVIFFRSFGQGMMTVYNLLNDFFTGRLLYGVCTYDMYGLSWLGRTIQFPPKQFWNGYWIDKMVFDNSYIWMLVLYGTVYLFIISALFLYIGKKTTNIEKILIVAYAFYAIMESYAINVVICFPLLFVGKYMHAKRNVIGYTGNEEE